VKCIETGLKDCFVLEPQVFEDERGLFFESYNQKRFQEAIGREINFVQDNQSISKKGVLRGLHFQEGDFAQSKLVNVIHGEVIDVVVDLRKESDTFGEHFKLRLSGDNNKMIFIPKGMAHGFVTLSEQAIFHYKCDEYYHKASENGILYNDVTLKIDWELASLKPILSPKDKNLPTFKSLFS